MHFDGPIVESREPKGLGSAESFLDRVIEKVEFAFQPIVNVHTGSCYGYEALLRGNEMLGFPSIQDLFDWSWRNGLLHRVDLALREKALGAFVAIDRGPEARMFYNLDTRILDADDFQPNQTLGLLKKLGISPSTLCLELTEHHEIKKGGDGERLLTYYRDKAYRIAIDDFGTGYSGLKLLYEYQPDLVKIDRFFISNIQRDAKKKLFVSTVVNLAHVLGISVVAEGVETEEEFLACKKIGCDLAQGYLIAKPTTRIEDLAPRYDQVRVLNKRDRRDDAQDRKIIWEQIEFLPPLRAGDGLEVVFDAFQRNKTLTYFPVIDDSGEPLGIVRESALKGYAYSPFGRELITNKGYGRTLRDYVTRCPVADINTEAEKILETYSLSESSEGIIIVNDFTYVGFLTAASLLRVINAKNLAVARDQNPLTKLPGNNSINEYVAHALEEPEISRCVVYFDFDNFKPFNDAYGFRQGDRAILMFAELMRKKLGTEGVFLGHVGGDDFFAGFEGMGTPYVAARLADLLSSFRKDVVSFYEREAQEAGFILAKGRDGKEQRFPLLACSAAVLELTPNRPRPALDEIVGLIFKMKKEAKGTEGGGGICQASLV